MSLDGDRQVVEELLEDNWSTTDIAWDGVEYSPTPGTSWVRLTVLPGEDQFLTLDNYRQVGLVIIQIFTPENQGSTTARGYADTITGIFRNVKQSGVLFRMPTTSRHGISEGWYQMNISIPYWREASL